MVKLASVSTSRGLLCLGTRNNIISTEEKSATIQWMSASRSFLSLKLSFGLSAPLFPHSSHRRFITFLSHSPMVNHRQHQQHHRDQGRVSSSTRDQQWREMSKQNINESLSTHVSQLQISESQRPLTSNTNLEFLRPKTIIVPVHASEDYHPCGQDSPCCSQQPETSGQWSINSIPPIQYGTISLFTTPASPTKVQKGIWMPKAYSTVSGAESVEESTINVDSGTDTKSKNDKETDRKVVKNSLSTVFQRGIRGPTGAEFTVDKNTYSQAQIRATFYPKFENEKSDQEVRTRMIEMVSNGLATLEVSLKHSGSLFMYAGHEGGAYAKNSFGNIYTAVGVFVLGRMFNEAWGVNAAKKQEEFNEFLEKNRMCISMELVTAVLGDHGQRPLDDYVSFTVLRKSVTSVFAAYDALCEEGTATSVCRALDEVADVSVPGSKDHVKVQGEILEGLVARIVSRDSAKHMEKVLKDFPPPPLDGAGIDLGPSLRDICAENRSDEQQQIKSLLQCVGTSFCPDQSDWFGDGDANNHSRNADRSVLSKFLQAHPADFATLKLEEMIRLMRQKHFPAAFKCYRNFHKTVASPKENATFKMVIHVHSDSGFRRYQKEMRNNPGLWPLYRGFFVDVNLFKVGNESAADSVNYSGLLFKETNERTGTNASGTDGLADEDANLMIKLKFLTYKLRTFLIRNGLSVLFKEGPNAYKAYYLRQMKIWGTSYEKQKELSKMLDEWAVYIRRKCGSKQLSSTVYLTEAELFLEQYARRSAQNQALIGSAGNLVSAEDFLAVVAGGRDEEGDLRLEDEIPPSSPGTTMLDTVPKHEGVIVFFPGIPGCAKSALCKEILNVPGGLGDSRPINSLMGDLIKGRYWQRVAEERKRKPNAITLADKNAPNEEVWRQIEDMCRNTKAIAVPVIPDSEGTDSNPFSLDALAVFIFRVLQRVNHPGNLDKASPNAGYVLLMFYHLYEGKNRREFEAELSERFGPLVKMPLLKTDRVDSTKGSYAKEWSQWEKRLREILFVNSEYLTSIQVPFDYAVQRVVEQLRAVAKGEYTTPATEKRKFGTIVYAAVTLPVEQIRCVLDKMADKYVKAKEFLKDKNMEDTLKRAHVTLAHKKSHGVTAVASYGEYHNKKVSADLTAFLFSDKLAAFEAHIGSVEGETICSKNEWPHLTVWTGTGAAAKDANTLPKLVSEGRATRIDLDQPITVTGVLDFH
ncbi:hypothetical protein AMTRI_Chr08g206200 [Amborella trichopoda]